MGRVCRITRDCCNAGQVTSSSAELNKDYLTQSRCIGNSSLYCVLENFCTRKKSEGNMCFSAGASFGASAALGIIGVVAITKARTIPQKLFASIPLIFSAQQITEGMLWLSFNDTSFQGRSLFTYIYLVFALMLWPVWIPLTIRLLEEDATRKKILNIFVIIGAIVSAWFAGSVFFCSAQAITTHHHIQYQLNFPPEVTNLIWPFNIFYFIATIVSTFISSIKRMKWLGIVCAIAYLFSLYFYSEFVISVWCYFAAVLSIIVLWIASGLEK